RLDRAVAAPVELRLGSDGLFVAQALGAGGAVGGAFADHRVFLADLHGVIRLHFSGQQGGGDTHRARGVGNVNHGIVLVVRVDLHRRVCLGGGGATDHQRQGEVLALHL